MTKLLSILTLILLIVLFPPSVLALISNNAVPGDVTYPIKRKLEDGILLIVSVNPATRAWFSASRSTRRFDEARILIAQGKQTAGASLEELVSQTEITAKQIDQIQDPIQKEQLKKQLVQSITQYNQGLNQIQKQIQPGQAEVVSKATPLPSVEEVISTPMPSISQLPGPTQASKITQPKIQPTPAIEPPVAPAVIATPAPQQAEVNPLPVSSDKLSEVQKQLKEIQKDLQNDDSKKIKEDKNKKDEKEKSDEEKNLQSKRNKNNDR